MSTNRLQDILQNEERTYSSSDLKRIHTVMMEERRKCCYAFNNLEWYIQEKLKVPMTVVRTGSFSEGVLFHDIDNMFFRNDILVVPIDCDNEFNVPVNPKPILCLLSMEEEDCHFGFTRLKLRDSEEKADFDLFTERSGDTYLSGQKLKQYLLAYDLRQNCGPVEGKHGPAITSKKLAQGTEPHTGTSSELSIPKTKDIDYDLDLVSSVKCTGWPAHLDDFLTRIKKFGIEKEMLPPCLFVPVSHPSSAEPDIEFRFSFSLIERFLIQKWTTKQIECYERAKAAKLNTDYEDKRDISSYLIKSAMFWLVENKPEEYWASSSSQICHQDLLKSIYDMFCDKHFPNYFISKQNLLECHTDEQIETVGTALLRQIESLSNFSEKYEKLIMLQDSEIIKFYSTRCKGYISETIHFCLSLYTRFDYVNSVLLEEVIKDVPFTHDPTVQQYIKIALTECLAIYKLYDAFEDGFATSKDYLIEQSRQLLLMQPEYPELLYPDYGLTRFVLLGIVYYIKGDRFWSLQCLMRAFDIKNQFDNSTWFHAAFPIHLPSSKDSKPPKCFQKEILHLLWIECRPNNVIIFDAYGLCLYFLFMLTGDKKYFLMLKETDDMFMYSSLTTFLVELMEQVWTAD